MDSNTVPTISKETGYDEIYWSSEDESEDIRNAFPNEKDEDMEDTFSIGDGEDKSSTDFMEYLDYVTYFVSLNNKDDVNLNFGNFINTNEILNEVKQNKAPPSTHIIDSSTRKYSENSYLQMPQQTSDDPRHGGKVDTKGRGAWNKDSNVEAELDEAMIVSAVVLSLQIQERGGVLQQDLQGAAAEGNSDRSIDGNIKVNMDRLTPEDNVNEIEPKTDSMEDEED